MSETDITTPRKAGRPPGAKDRPGVKFAQRFMTEAYRRLWGQTFPAISPPTRMPDLEDRRAEFLASLRRLSRESHRLHHLGPLDSPADCLAELLLLVGGTCWEADRRADLDLSLRLLVVVREWIGKEDADRLANAEG